jgi:transcriptional regulator with XRE-family HTH domain
LTFSAKNGFLQTKTTFGGSFMLKLAKNHRLLRQAKSLTQEEFAAFLNVSSQAVSKWESDRSYPDITLLPAMAQFFGATVDDLLGMDDIKSRAERGAIMAKAAELINSLDTAKYMEAVDLLREALKYYTDDYEMMQFLSQLLISYDVTRKSLMQEAIALEERILTECKDGGFQHNALVRLAEFHADIGDTEKALEYAERLPTLEQSREWVLSKHIYRGAERVPHIQRTVKALVQLINFELLFLTDDSTVDEMRFSQAERIWLFETADKLCTLLYGEDADVIYVGQSAFTSVAAAKCAATDGDRELTLAALWRQAQTSICSRAKSLLQLNYNIHEIVIKMKMSIVIAK